MSENGSNCELRFAIHSFAGLDDSTRPSQKPIPRSNPSEKLLESQRKKVAAPRRNPSPLRSLVKLRVTTVGVRSSASVWETCLGERRPPPDIASRSVALRDHDVQVIVPGNGHSIIQTTGSRQPGRRRSEHRQPGRRRSEHKQPGRRRSGHKRPERRRSGHNPNCSHETCST